MPTSLTWIHRTKCQAEHQGPLGLFVCCYAGTVGIMLGFLFRLSCLIFVVPYWYLFMLDKTVWNNHSYLYGLCGLLFLVSDANRYW